MSRDGRKLYESCSEEACSIERDFEPPHERAWMEFDEAFFQRRSNHSELPKLPQPTNVRVSEVGRNGAVLEISRPSLPTKKDGERVTQERLGGFVYTAETETGPELVDALEALMDAYGFKETDREEPRYGSYFQRFTAWVKNKADSPEGVDAREKAQRALELKVLDKEQAGVDAQQAEAVARVITALEKTERCALLVGSLLVVKLPDVTVARNLTQRQMLRLTKNPELQMQPEKLMELLRESEASCERKVADLRPEMETGLALAHDEHPS